ncbi:MAG TPA: M20/M25/M40 family metallo-hydrolase [Candidatus Saccharimonadia bacterium]|nr:M20/M25/M40 family metallo-hydrolase [Candidatus Saccharimonadia bacterium]
MKMLALLLAGTLASPASGADSPTDAIRAWRVANEPRITAELESLLRLPNVATNLEDVRRNADAIAAMLRERGLAPQLLVGSDAETPPVVFAQWRVPGAKRTLVFYAHYDGQPVDAAEWASDPWTPTWRDDRLDRGGKEVALKPGTRPDPDWRVYARGAADDKAGVVAIINAIGALKASGLEPAVNVKLFFEGEEEAGSPHLRDVLTLHRELLEADAWVICDGPVHASGRKQVVFGVRGDMNVHVTVHGPRRPLHSGHYGNWAPNPAMRLAELLATMQDDDGRVLIAGCYDDVVPLGAAERHALAAMPVPDEALRRELGLARTALDGMPLAEAINLPSLNLNGIRAGNVGDEASNAIMTAARATLDLRLVAGIAPEAQYRRLVRHIEREGWLVLERDPTDAERLAHDRLATVVAEPGGYAASRTAMDLPVSRAVSAAVQSTSGGAIVEVPTLGGSLPLVHINEILGAPTIGVPIANHDNNQHAEDENLRIGNLWDGIETMAALMRATWCGARRADAARSVRDSEPCGRARGSAHRAAAARSRR